MSTQPTPDPEENPDQQWTAVSREEPARPPLPSFVKFGGLALLAVMVIAAVLIGVALGGGGGESELVIVAASQGALVHEFHAKNGFRARE